MISRETVCSTTSPCAFPISIEAKRFTKKLLAPLGYTLSEENLGRNGQRVAGFCAGNKRDFWLSETGTIVGGERSCSCYAFGAPNAEAVDAFYNEAMLAGGTDNGKPGYRPDYHPGYYAAFVLDPDGNNIEAVYDDWAKANEARK